MALGTNHLANTSASIQEFIPEVWSDDIIASYKANLVVANLVSKINHRGKRGDIIHIPSPVRGSANAKTVGSQVTLNQNNSTEVQVSIDKWFEYSSMIEDIINIQALPSMRRHITDDAGYALATRVDRDLHLLGATLQSGAVATTGATSYEAAVIGGDGSTSFSGAASSGTGNGSDLTDAGIRQMIQSLDDADVPFGSRAIIIPPCQKNVLLGLSRFTEQAFTGEAGMGNSIRNGKLGDIYGIEVYVSTACPWVHVNSTTSTQSVTFSSTTPTSSAYEDELGATVNWGSGSDTKYRAGLILHKDALVHAEAMGIRSQAQYKQEYLGTLLTSDTIYGVAELRDTAAVPFVVPA